MKTVATEGPANMAGNPAYGASMSNPSVTVAVTPKRIAWTAIFAGAVLALVTQLLLSMLGTAIGLSTVDPLQPEGTPSAEAMGIGAGLWWIISGFLALLFGGWVAGKLSGSPWSFDGALHGLLVFALVTLIGTYIVGSALTNLVQGGASLVGSGANAALSSMMNGNGQAGGQQGAQNNQNSSGGFLDEIKRDAQSLFSNTEASGGNDAASAGGSAQQEFDAILQRLVNGRGNNSAEADRKALINLLTTRAGMNRKDAEARVEGWENTIRGRSQNLEQGAREAADDTARALSKTALWGFMALLLGATGATLGGAAGTSSRLGRTNAKNIPATALN